MPGVKLTTQAYCKMVLHGAKYPHCAVNGLLVAEKQKPRKEHLPLGGPGGPHTLFVDCIPLFHGTLALAPMLEVALTLVSAGGAASRRGVWSRWRARAWSPPRRRRRRAGRPRGLGPGSGERAAAAFAVGGALGPFPTPGRPLRGRAVAEWGVTRPRPCPGTGRPGYGWGAGVRCRGGLPAPLPRPRSV